MSYTLDADIYLGDVSSQVLEFLSRPRPCIFLNSNRLSLGGSPYWRLGRVVEDITGMEVALATRESWRAEYVPAQRRAFEDSFPVLDQPAPERAARAIASFMRDGRLPGALAAA